MSVIKSDDSKKWISSFVAVICVIVVFLAMRLFAQLGEWFDLEAKVPFFVVASQVVAVAIGVGSFLAVLNHAKAKAYLNEVFVELVKVIWPDKDSVFKSTIGIIIGLAITSGLFVGIDYGFRKLLSLLY